MNGRLRHPVGDGGWDVEGNVGVLAFTALDIVDVGNEVSDSSTSSWPTTTIMSARGKA